MKQMRIAMKTNEKKNGRKPTPSLTKKARSISFTSPTADDPDMTSNSSSPSPTALMNSALEIVWLVV